MTNPELAVLSLIAEEPRHGYDVEKIIEARGMRDWTEIGFSSIYYLLNKLEGKELIESHLSQPGGKGPARKVYEITDAGRQVHQEGVREALSTPKMRSSSFLLGLSNLPFLTQEESLDALKKYADEIERRLAHMLSRADEQQPLASFVAAMFAYSRTLAEAELHWINKYIKELEEENG
jgi:DNA-binding PadR family transcriptional regulator